MPVLLQPEDSRRVADAILAKIEDADLDLAYEFAAALNQLLRPDGLYRAGWLADLIASEVSALRSNLEGIAWQAAQK